MKVAMIGCGKLGQDCAEVMAENLALRCLKNGKNITIIGKSYKPNIPYICDSYSMLVGHYIEQHGGSVNYYDKNTGDLDLRSDWTQVVLIGYWDTWTMDALNKSNIDQKDTPVIIDPWRKINQPEINSTLKLKAEIIPYGDTRSNRNEYAAYKNNFKWWYEDSCRKLFTLWPELEQHEDTIHLIEAECSAHNDFMLRPTESIVEEILEAKRNGKTKFLFLGLVEAYSFQLAAKINRIADLVINHIDSKNLIYLCSSIGVSETYKENPEVFRLAHNNKISIWSACSAQMFYQLYEENGAAYKGKLSYEIRVKDKNFLSFNRVPRQHRLKLIEQFLKHKELLDSGYLSFDPPIDQLTQMINSLDNLPHLVALKENLPSIPMKLNITPERTNPANLQPDDIRYFNDSYFSIVTETGFYNTPNAHELHTNVFFTEKVFKPIVAMHPFVLFCYSGALEKLKEMGYRTFSPFIDETYDTIKNPDERFEAIWNEIVRLLQKTPEQWIQWQTNVRQIVEHNHIHFFNNNNYLATDIRPYFT